MDKDISNSFERNDPHMIQEFRDQLYSLREDGGFDRIVLDFRRVERYSSQVLGIMLSLQRKLDAAGGWLKLCELHGYPLEIIQITGLEPNFKIFATVEDALASE